MVVLVGVPGRPPVVIQGRPEGGVGVRVVDGAEGRVQVRVVREVGGVEGAFKRPLRVLEVLRVVVEARVLGARGTARKVPRVQRRFGSAVGPVLKVGVRKSVVVVPSRVVKVKTTFMVVDDVITRPPKALAKSLLRESSFTVDVRRPRVSSRAGVEWVPR